MTQLPPPSFSMGILENFIKFAKIEARSNFILRSERFHEFNQVGLTYFCFTERPVQS